METTRSTVARAKKFLDGKYLDLSRLLGDVTGRKVILTPDKTGCEEIPPQEIFGENKKWRFAISSRGEYCAVGEPMAQSVTLFGKTGYNQGPDTLNYIADQLYSCKEKGLIARAMDEEDFKNWKNKENINLNFRLYFLASNHESPYHGCTIYGMRAVNTWGRMPTLVTQELAFSDDTEPTFATAPIRPVISIPGKTYYRIAEAPGWLFPETAIELF